MFVVAWLINVVWPNDGAARRTIARLEQFAPAPDVRLVVIDKAPFSAEERQRALASVNVPGALVEVVDPSSPFAKDVLRRAFATDTAHGFFKNTLAYFWGLARCADLGVRYVVHLDDDVYLLKAPVDVLRVDGLVRRVGREFQRSWVDVAIAGLKADASLFAVCPLPRTPAPLGAHSSQMHDAATTCDDDCGFCDRPTRLDVVGNAFGAPRASVLATGDVVCGHTVGGYRPYATHFSFQAFVLDLVRFTRMWPLNDGDARRDVETLVEDASNRSGLIALFVLPAWLGVVKVEG